MIYGVSHAGKWTLAAAVAGMALIGCRADDPETPESTEEERTVDGDTVIVTQTDSDIEGRLIVNEIQGETGELDELDRVAVEEADTLYDNLDAIPEVTVIQGQYFDRPDRWSMAVDAEQGDILAVSPLTHLSFLLARRDGLAGVDGSWVEALQNEVLESLAPGVIDIHSGSGEFPELGDEGELGLADTDLLALYRLALEDVAQREEDDEDAVDQQLQDGGSGVVDGRDDAGEPLGAIQYDPLTFVPVYETKLGGLAAEFGSDALNAFITGDEDAEGVEAARFISRDARCDVEFTDNYFAANAGEVALSVGELSGVYEERFGEQDEYRFDVSSDGTVTVTDDEGETLDVAQEALFTCSQSAFDGTQERSLVRYVTDLTDDGQRDELVMVGGGDEALVGEGDNGGIYLASEDGSDLAVFGDVDPRGGFEDPAEDEPRTAASCSLEGFNSFGPGVDGVTIEEDTTGLAGINNADLAVDGDKETAATMNVFLGLLGLGSAEIVASAEAAPEDAGQTEQATVLVSIPDSILNLSLLDSITVETFLDGEEQASNVNLNLLELDIAGGFNDASLRALEMDSGAFDALRIYINAGVLGMDIRLQVHDICYGPIDPG